MRFSLLCFFLLFSTLSLIAQDCYDRYLQEGIAAYGSLDFETAIKKFEAANICPDRPEGEEVNPWLEKAKNGYLEAIKAAKAEAEQRLAELAAANERIVASMIETLNGQLHGLEFNRALGGVLLRPPLHQDHHRIRSLDRDTLLGCSHSGCGSNHEEEDTFSEDVHHSNDP